MMEDPHCHALEELPSAAAERKRVRELLARRSDASDDELAELSTPLAIHLSRGLAYTIGSALGALPPSTETCLAAFLVHNKVGLTAGARAWSKHAHRSQPAEMAEDERGRRKASEGWWGAPSGPVATVNEKALALFWKVMNGASWRNLHWLPHQVLVYEVRVPEGYGLRWSQDQSADHTSDDAPVLEAKPWTFRGFVEPMMENGHELGWKHPI